MQMVCAGAVKDGTAKKCAFQKPLNLPRLKFKLWIGRTHLKMLEVALTTRSEALVQKITRALPNLASCVTRYECLQQLSLDNVKKKLDLIVVHHADDQVHDEASVYFERDLSPSTPAIAIIPDQHLDWSVPLLNAGVDRCLPESFDETHFSAVVRALTRRNHGLTSSVSQYGVLTFHHASKQAWLRGQEIELTKREAQVLEVLLKRVGQIIAKEEFIEEIDPHNIDLNASAVEVYIHRLRKKIKPEYLPIRNIKRCGYFLMRFDVAGEVQPPANPQLGRVMSL